LRTDGIVAIVVNFVEAINILVWLLSISTIIVDPKTWIVINLGVLYQVILSNYVECITGKGSRAIALSGSVRRVMPIAS